MRAVIQRVSRASVMVDDQERGSFEGEGLLVLLGVTHLDGPEQVAIMSRKIAELRILDEERSVIEVGAPVMVVSQFTLYGNTKKGRRPSWSAAAPGAVAEPLINQVVDNLRAQGLRVETGEFGAMMRVELINEGPFTVLVEA